MSTYPHGDGIRESIIRLLRISPYGMMVYQDLCKELFISKSGLHYYMKSLAAEGVLELVNGRYFLKERRLDNAEK